MPEKGAHISLLENFKEQTHGGGGHLKWTAKYLINARESHQCQGTTSKVKLDFKNLKLGVYPVALKS